jgi:uncharacterized protein (DUF1330 family)
MLAGFGLGAVVVQGVQAQRTGPGAYAIIDVTEISDPTTFRSTFAKEQATLAPFGGRFVTRTSDITALDGVAPLRFVIIAFDNASKAASWNDSPAQAQLNDARMRSTKSRSFIIAAEGAGQ